MVVPVRRKSHRSVDPTRIKDYLYYKTACCHLGQRPYVKDGPQEHISYDQKRCDYVKAGSLSWKSKLSGCECLSRATDTASLCEAQGILTGTD